MKKLLICLTVILGMSQMLVRAQDFSQYNVRYMVTYNEAEKQYTAWVVPEYDTPNTNNGSSEEKGATAQFSLKVPAGVSISDIQDIRGTWMKQPQKFGSEATLIKSGADKGYQYYVIGKNPSETNYGSFKNGEPVALFKFKSKGGNVITALESNDPIVKIADESMSLNVRSSFYSRSGQRPTMHAMPLEQFTSPTKLETVLAAANKNAGVSASAEITDASKVITYPNPVKDVVNVKFFSSLDKEQANVEMVDMLGSIKQSKQVETQLGFNSLQLNVAQYPSGTYIIRTTLGGKINTNKVVKVN